jgi:hypothetical protein
VDGETAAGSWPRFLSAETADSAIQILTGAFTSVLSSGARLQAARSRSAQIAQIAPSQNVTGVGYRLRIYWPPEARHARVDG